MKITSIEAFKLSLKYAEPLTISFHTFHYSYNFFLKFTTDTGLVGWGEGAPFKPITGDSAEEVMDELGCLSKLKGCEFTSPEELLSKLDCRSATLKAACDTVFHDILAQSQKVPVYKLFSTIPRKVPNSVTVFIKGDLDATVKETERILSLYPDLEVLKIKLQGSDDVARCRAIHEVSPPNFRYVLDANQGYANPQKAVSELNQIIEILGDVLLIEEPCPKHDYVKSKYVKDHIRNSKIFADESCCSLDDLDMIIKENAFDGINIKMQKAGGISHSRALAKRAEDAGMNVMIGQMFEAPLSTAASLAIAVTCGNVILTDLDMDLDLPIFSTGKTDFSSGYRKPEEVPGFGFVLINDKIQQLSSQGLCLFEQREIF